MVKTKRCDLNNTNIIGVFKMKQSKENKRFKWRHKHTAYATISFFIIFIVFMVFMIKNGIHQNEEIREKLLKAKIVCLDKYVDNPCKNEKCAIELNIDFRINYEMLLQERYRNCLLENGIKVDQK